MTNCKCGKRMLQHANEGTCLWCGYGNVHAVTEFAYQLNMEHNAPVLARPAPIDGRVVAFSPRPTWNEDDCVLAYRRWTASNGRQPNAFDWQQPIIDGEPKRPSYATIHARFGGWHGFLQHIAEVPREQAA